jgi:hypothetical protein
LDEGGFPRFALEVGKIPVRGAHKGEVGGDCLRFPRSRGAHKARRGYITGTSPKRVHHWYAPQAASAVVDYVPTTKYRRQIPTGCHSAKTVRVCVCVCRAQVYVACVWVFVVYSRVSFRASCGSVVLLTLGRIMFETRRTDLTFAGLNSFNI